MTDTDPIVTSADLVPLQNLRDAGVIADDSRLATLLDRLIAVAEVDLPPLPEREPLVYRFHDGDERVLYLQPDGWLTSHRDGAGKWGRIGGVNQHRLTPLRPKVTAEQVDAAMTAVACADCWPTRSHMRAAFKAVGFEVES